MALCLHLHVLVVDLLEVLAELVDLRDELHILLHDLIVLEVHALAVGLHLVLEAVHTLLQELTLVALLLLIRLENATDVLPLDLGLLELDDLVFELFLVELDADVA